MYNLELKPHFKKRENIDDTTLAISKYYDYLHLIQNRVHKTIITSLQPLCLCDFYYPLRLYIGMAFLIFQSCIFKININPWSV